MRLPQEFLSLELDELIANNVQVRMMGWRDDLPTHTLSAVETAVEKTKHNTGLVLNFALNYGSRREIIEAVRQLAVDVRDGNLRAEDINDSVLSERLLSSDLPDPDLLIRTSGEIRISNFMLWQCAYTEFVFTDVYWPAFTKEHFYEAIRIYQQRVRRYGGLMT
jgi:undecaprenyl diphosphate synthase